jgi:nitrogen-specific signal transduction histidine kinase/CheY-like chemotaxis protein
MRESRHREEELNRLVDLRTRELQETLTELKHTQQFRDQFLANMSHEIRTPMNAIVGLTNLLVQSKLDDQQEKYLQVIKKSGDNLLVIINDILDLSKIEAGKMELETAVFSLHKTLEHLSAILMDKANQKNISWEVTFDAATPEYIIGDETRLTQILMNLTGNAIKFTGQGGVTLTASTKLTKNGSADITFSVADTGIGIPADKLDKIFESFGQASADTARKYGGTGLGLNISRQLIEMHHGRLSVESTPGKGSKFYFTIQYPVSAVPNVLSGGSTDADVQMEGKKILLVEDNEFNQLVAEDTIRSLFPGIEVDIAENGRTAIAMASANDYDLLLMDIQLPDIDGYEVTRFIRKELEPPRSSVPICALTASISDKRISDCLAAGMNDYMMKPFLQETLKNKILTTMRKSSESMPDRFEKVRQFMLEKQKTELPAQYYYHSIAHVVDVMEIAESLCRSEQLPAVETELLLVAALFHDSGFINTRKNHEESSCRLAASILPDYGYSNEDIQVINQLIMVTQLPQSPVGLAEQIICDADMDYLGRDDYFEIADALQKEMIEAGEFLPTGDWDTLQLSFLEQHTYHTNTSREKREFRKRENIEMVRQRAAI